MRIQSQKGNELGKIKSRPELWAFHFLSTKPEKSQGHSQTVTILVSYQNLKVKERKKRGWEGGPELTLKLRSLDMIKPEMGDDNKSKE